MATKKQNRRNKVRRFRRAFKRLVDVGSKITGHRIHCHGYGIGIGRNLRTAMAYDQEDHK